MRRVFKQISALQAIHKGTRSLLHSLTHGGTAQLGMRFDGNEIGSSVSNGQMLLLLGA